MANLFICFKLMEVLKICIKNDFVKVVKDNGSFCEEKSVFLISKHSFI